MYQTNKSVILRASIAVWLQNVATLAFNEGLTVLKEQSALSKCYLPSHTLHKLLSNL